MYSIVFFNYTSDVFVTLRSLNAADNTLFAFEETIYGLCGRQPTDYCRQVSNSYTIYVCTLLVYTYHDLYKFIILKFVCNSKSS